MHATIGDEIVVTDGSGHHAARTGVITAVLSHDGREHYRVAWDDGHTTIFYPSSTTGAVQIVGKRAPADDDDT